ncbi:vacuolar ATP synthase subunit h, putative [Theileria annulata]|uniref:V-type proton ATPase subunit H n=1 Tax=Theileria annulata TaxID=5874 RepID=Q4UD25_THEAN|nr:vacuolar ATP synthase subunit h, putative [Theileria annulata]CAI75276.1 vacuolar ATP synthase subunit h, putative [Theileria annulata]|eukprot:XP_954752.1 vacuolar ATP synthase subunit h, putative [Theileria annulata]
MEPEILNKLMLKNKINYDLVNPEYDEWLITGALDTESVELIKHFTSLNSLERVEMVKKDNLILKILLNATYATGPGLLRLYSLQHIHDICRIDNHIYNILLEILNHRDVYSIYYDIITHEKDKKIIQIILYLLTGFIAYNKNNIFNNEEIDNIINLILKLTINDYSKLYSLSNILQLSKYHVLIENESVLTLIKNNLDKEILPNSQYKAIFCLWLVSRTNKYIEYFYQQKVIHLLCNILSTTKIEKIIRISLLLFKNLLNNINCLQVIVEYNIINSLTLLLYDKWNDTELYDNLQKLLVQLENKLIKFSNYERYCNELNNGILKWSILHSGNIIILTCLEKFWMLHNEKFEQDEFINISKLINLLYTSDDSTTISIVLYDLGEFFRLYRNSKNICKKFKVKDKILDLITNKNRDISRQAMLCIQKLMVQNWQQVNNTNNQF